MGNSLQCHEIKLSFPLRVPLFALNIGCHTFLLMTKSALISRSRFFSICYIRLLLGISIPNLKLCTWKTNSFQFSEVSAKGDMRKSFNLISGLLWSFFVNVFATTWHRVNRLQKFNFNDPGIKAIGASDKRIRDFNPLISPRCELSPRH